MVKEITQAVVLHLIFYMKERLGMNKNAQVIAFALFSFILLKAHSSDFDLPPSSVHHLRLQEQVAEQIEQISQTELNSSNINQIDAAANSYYERINTTYQLILSIVSEMKSQYKRVDDAFNRLPPHIQKRFIAGEFDNKNMIDDFSKQLDLQFVPLDGKTANNKSLLRMRKIDGQAAINSNLVELEATIHSQKEGVELIHSLSTDFQNTQGQDQKLDLANQIQEAILSQLIEIRMILTQVHRVDLSLIYEESEVNKTLKAHEAGAFENPKM